MGGFFSQIGELYVVHHLWGRLGTLQDPLWPPFSTLSPCQQCEYIRALVELTFQQREIPPQT